MRWQMFFLSLALGAGLILSSCRKLEPTPVTFDWDNGPTEIDAATLAKYPPDIQATYNNVVKAKCVQCHKLSRSIWAPYYDQALWGTVINKMANRPGSQVETKDVDAIVKFMVHDHTQRKAAIEEMFTKQGWQKKDPVGL